MLLGWDGIKNEEVRKVLSSLKDSATELFDHSFNYISEKVKEFLADDKYELLFINSREPDEIKRFVKEFKCITVHVINPNIKVLTSNHADANTDLYNYDYMIYNNGTLTDYENQAKAFAKEVMIHK